MLITLHNQDNYSKNMEKHPIFLSLKVNFLNLQYFQSSLSNLFKLLKEEMAMKSFEVLK